MVICKFFVQGTCRYGNKCWYEHPRGASGGNSQRQLSFDNYNDGRESRGNVFQSNNRQQLQQQQQQQQQQNKFKWVAPHLASGSEAASQQQSPQEIISVLSREITNWENSKMWPLSCVGFGKSGPSIPGMADMSPDELRFEAYNSLTSEQYQNYILKVQQMHNDYSAKRQELKNPSAQLKDKLIQFIESNRRQSLATANSPSSPTQSSAFGSSNAFGQPLGFISGATKVFGQGAKNLFGQSETSSSPFQSQGSAFGNSSGNMVCNFTNVPNQGNNTFGNVNNVFGGVQTASPLQNVYGNTSSFNTSQSLAANSQMSVFGNSTPQLNQNNSFGSVFNNSTLPSNVGNSSGTGLFGKPISQQNSVFGQQSVQQPSPFGSAMPSGTTRSVFDQVASVGSSVFAQQGPPAPESSTIYTLLADLTPPELEQYQAQKFILGKIPTRPPPKELCY